MDLFASHLRSSNWTTPRLRKATSSLVDSPMSMLAKLFHKPTESPQVNRWKFSSFSSPLTDATRWWSRIPRFFSCIIGLKRFLCVWILLFWWPNCFLGHQAKGQWIEKSVDYWFYYRAIQVGFVNKRWEIRVEQINVWLEKRMIISGLSDYPQANDRLHKASPSDHFVVDIRRSFEFRRCFLEPWIDCIWLQFCFWIVGRFGVISASLCLSHIISYSIFLGYKQIGDASAHDWCGSFYRAVAC